MESNHQSLPHAAILASSTSSTWIDEDLMPEILKRLPVKSLCRFQSVSKSWKFLISSPSFITLQFFTSSTTPANLKSYIHRGDFGNRCHNDYIIHRPQDEHFGHKLHFPFRFRDVTIASYLHEFEFVDLINGVICLSYSMNCYSYSIILWNPAIHKYVTLPSQPFPSADKLDLDIHCTAHFYQNSIGFGYNNSMNDFKVVRIWIPNYPCECDCKSLVPFYDVYSARDGIWRMEIAEDIMSCQICNDKGCFLNGTIHWLVELESVSRYSVLMFDCEHEKFTTMDLPPEIDQGYQNVEKELLVYGGMLSVLANWDEDIELWVMEEYGVASTWKKAYELSKDIEVNSYAIDVYRSHYQKLAPYGPKEWIKFRWNDDMVDNILCNNVYEESMFLIDETDSQSYQNQEIVHVDLS